MPNIFNSSTVNAKICIYCICFIPTIWLSSPSLLLEIIGAGRYEAVIGQALFCFSILILYAVNKCKVQFKTILKCSLILLFGFTLTILYEFFSLENSSKQMIGATLKVALFFLLVALFQKDKDRIYWALSLTIFPILLMSAIATFMHNIFQFEERFRVIIGSQEISVLWTALGTSRIYIDGEKLYRISAIFNEPGDYGLILYCLMLFYISSGRFSNWYKAIFAINIISTFSFGAFISMSVALLSRLSIQNLVKIFSKGNKLTQLVLALGLGFIIYTSISGLVFVFSRLSFQSSCKLFSGDNRFFDDKLPANFLLGDGSYGGGFDSIVSILSQFGILGCLILFAPVLHVSFIFFQKRQYAFAIGLLLFLLHKPLILTPVIILLLAAVCANLSKDVTVS